MSNIAYKGTIFQLEYAILKNGSMPAKDFIDSLDKSDKAKAFKLIEKMGDNGRIPNKLQFKKIEGTEFFEFKKFKVRIPCYFKRGGRLVLTHGFVKKSDRIDKSQIERAERIKQEYELRRR